MASSDSSTAAPNVTCFVHDDSGTCQYIVRDPSSKKAALVDLCADFDAPSARIHFASVQPILDQVKAEGLEIEYILETHAHADHLSAAPFAKRELGNKPQITIGAGIKTVQETFAGVYELGPDFLTDGSQFDKLLADGEEIAIGGLTLRAIYTPGHTPACATYAIGDSIFVGDTLFMPDIGSARCDFPGGSAVTMWASIQKLLAFPDATRMFVCHDYPPASRQARWETSVQEQRDTNKHLGGGGITTEAQYVEARTQRDAQLKVPRLLLPSIQVNIRAGNMPEPAAGSTTSFLKLPINKL